MKGGREVMPIRRNRFRAQLLVIGAFLFALFACQLSQEADVKTTITLNSMYDTLKQYDSVVISLKDPKDGHTIDVAFSGKVNLPGDLDKRPTPHWDGGKAVIEFQGYKDGELVFRMKSPFDGQTNRRDSTYVYVVPGMSLAYPSDNLTLIEGQAIPLPSISVNPPDLSDQRLLWSSSAPEVVLVLSDSLKPLKKGNAQVTVRMAIDTSRSFTFKVNVVERGSLPESLGLSADTLHLAAGGAASRLDLSFTPSTAAKDVFWTVDDTLIARVDPDGTVRGLKTGITLLRVRSVVKTALGDSAVVAVSEPIPVQRVAFSKHATELFAGGAAESLVVTVLPPGANPEVVLSAVPAEVLQLTDGRIKGLAAGEGTVIARSKENSALSDTLRVKVTVKQDIEKVTLDKTRFTLYTGGDVVALNASVAPSGAVQKVQWRSAGPSIAKVSDSGTVTGLSPGRTYIHALSQADSTKQDSAEVTVKTDAPVLNVGRSDTTVSVGSTVTLLPVVAPQEFGVVVKFKWDLDGAEGWDDSSSALKALTVKFDKEQDITLRFYVRDTEGNETIAAKKVTAVLIDTTPPGAPKVFGTTPTNNAPRWTWKSGGGGAGVYRYKVGGDPTGSPETTDTAYVQPSPVSKTTYALSIQERDAAGNWSQVTTYPIYFDLSKPAVAFTSPQVSGTFLTKNATVDLSGTSSSPQGAGAVKSVTYTVDGAAGTLATNLAGDGSWSIKSLPLTNNKTTVVTVAATDVANNQAEASLSILMDNTAPAAPAFTAQPHATVNKADTTSVLRWAWGRTGDATDSFVVKLNGTEVARQAGTGYALNSFADGNYLLEVSEKDLAGNASTFTKGANVLVDRVAPSAPDLSQPPSPRRTAQWTWTGGGGGNGTFKCVLDGGAEFACTSPYNLPTPTDGDHTLKVRELDAAGNASGYASTTVTIDLVKPKLTISSYTTVPAQIFNIIKPITGSASDDRQIKTTLYRIGNGTYQPAGGANFNFTPALDTGTQVVTIRTEDQAGNYDSVQLTLSYEPKVIFVRAGASGDGSSWANPLGDLAAVLRSDKSYPAQTQIWVAEGSYSTNEEYGFALKPYVGICGGFASEGTDRSLGARDLVNNLSILTPGPNTMEIVANTWVNPQGTQVTVDHFSLSDFTLSNAEKTNIMMVYLYGATEAVINNIAFATLESCYTGLRIDSSNVEIIGAKFNLLKTVEGAVHVHNRASKVRIRNSSVWDNSAPYGSGGIYIETGSLCIGSNSSVSGNTPHEVEAGGSFSYESSVIFGGNGIEGPSTQVPSCPAPF